MHAIENCRIIAIENMYCIQTPQTMQYGALLNQYNETTNCEQPIAYYSRKLRETETKYSFSEREALTIFKGVKTLNLIFWLQKFKFITDHTALKYSLKNKNTDP